MRALRWFIFSEVFIFLLPCMSGGDPFNLNEKVTAYLKKHAGDWNDLNITESDGRALHDIILSHKYTRALEIGTSTGHSSIWIAWALSKTGGKLITIEIDENRYKKAIENFREAGVAEYIDARLADAHELVGELEGPFDFVFSDADKIWYKTYLELLLPKLEKGGCFTAHNVLNTNFQGIEEFLDYLKSVKTMDTTILTTSSSGLSVSYKKSD